MTGRYVRLSLAKELRETLRDRRTLAMMVLFPLVVYPLLALVGTQLLAAKQRDQEARASRVVVLGQGPVADEVRIRLGKDTSFELRPQATLSDVDRGEVDAAVVVERPSGATRDRAEIVFDATRDEGREAEQRLDQVLARIWPETCAPLLEVGRRDVAPKSRMGGYLLSKALPLMILIMVLLGAFYPAIDVTAGERERGTLETILATPIPRVDLLLGKVLAVTLLASLSGALNLGSMSITLVQVVNLTAPEAELPVPWSRAAATGLIILPTAFLLSAVFVAVGSFARGFKEAQNLLMPVYFLFLAPAMMGALGDFRLGVGAALVPGLNVTLLARDIALGQASGLHTALVLGSTLLWGLVALGLAARLYVSERFLSVGEDLGEQRRKPGSAPTQAEPPTPGEAVALFAVGYLLLYFVFIPLQARGLVSGLLISQWAGLFGLSFLYLRATKRPFGPTLGLSPSHPGALGGAVAMACGGWVIANLVAQWVLPPPKEYIEAFRKVLFPETMDRGLGASLFLFAFTPAVCEEVFFRGLILRGLLRRMPPGPAIALGAVMFGLFHVDIYRLLPTTLLGVMLGFIAWRSRSLWPAIVAHFLNNAILVALGTAGLDQRLEKIGAAAQVGMALGAIALVALGLLILLRVPKPASP